MSSVAALNLTSSTDGLFNAETLKASSSDTFGALIAAIVSITQTDSSAPTSPVRVLISPYSPSKRTEPSRHPSKCPSMGCLGSSLYFHRLPRIFGFFVFIEGHDKPPHRYQA
ncbi:hypothetical protein P171DRAFT_253783 [Karstenula rhodostoma CBS 690.94]|uniref:Uncharacterized protein n=1 Tax=Karstenula rhodostoma CBS 690.94 TaxID=1392251 RepID=A0A9P4PJE2_9PLEO|nr:hypothetical protein P171DRAFT_253783 [Karstenula rhodostoma CBS 690.94]